MDIVFRIQYSVKKKKASTKLMLIIKTLIQYISYSNHCWLYNTNTKNYEYSISDTVQYCINIENNFK